MKSKKINCLIFLVSLAFVMSTVFVFKYKNTIIPPKKKHKYHWIKAPNLEGTLVIAFAKFDCVK